MEFVCGTYGVPHFRSPMISVRKRETKSIGEMVGPTPKMTKEADVHFVLDHLDHQGFVWNNYKCASLLLLFPFLFFSVTKYFHTIFWGERPNSIKMIPFYFDFCPKKILFRWLNIKFFPWPRYQMFYFSKKKLFHGVWRIT